MEIKSWLTNFWASMVKNGCDLPANGTVNSAVSQKWFDGWR